MAVPKEKINKKDDEFYMQTAYNLSKKSHCVSKQVGAVLVKDGRIISMGYNGSHSGNVNCNQVFEKDNFDLEEHHNWSRIYEVHAEMNCLSFAAKNGIDTNNCSLFVTLSPCQDCLKTLIQAGIKRIVYLVQYHRNLIPQDLLSYLKDNDIHLELLIPKKMFLSREECVRFSKYKKTGLYEKVVDSVRYYTSYIPDKDIVKKRELEQRLIHIKYNIRDVPRCKYTNEIQHFDKYGYIGVSKTAKDMMSRLANVKKAKWISLDFLCGDLNFEEIAFLMKDSGTKNFFFTFRQIFSENVFSNEFIENRLVEIGYEKTTANLKANSIKSGRSLVEFISWLNWSR